MRTSLLSFALACLAAPALAGGGFCEPPNGPVDMGLVRSDRGAVLIIENRSDKHATAGSWVLTVNPRAQERVRALLTALAPEAVSRHTFLNWNDAGIAESFGRWVRVEDFRGRLAVIYRQVPLRPIEPEPPYGGPGDCR